MGRQASGMVWDGAPMGPQGSEIYALDLGVMVRLETFHCGWLEQAFHAFTLMSSSSSSSSDDQKRVGHTAAPAKDMLPRCTGGADGSLIAVLDSTHGDLRVPDTATWERDILYGIFSQSQ